MAHVELTNDAREDLRDLDGSVRRLVFKGLAKLRDEPEKRGEPLGARAIGNLSTFRKLVVGNRAYRIVYRVEADGRVVVVWVIAERADDECYELATARLSTYTRDPALRAELEAMISTVWATTKAMES